MEKLINELKQKIYNKNLDELFVILKREFGDKIAMASSLGAEDQVITDIIGRAENRIKIFVIDTGKLHLESYNLLDKTSNKYNLNIKVFSPDFSDIEHLANNYDKDLYYNSIEERKLCCEIRKLKPLRKALNGLEAWITGLRKSQSITREEIDLVEWDDVNGLIKINPLINWSSDDVWNYIHEHNVPYNILHDQNYPSIGCRPCTRAIEPGEDIRAGRWWWEKPEHKECGLHKKPVT